MKTLDFKGLDCPQPVIRTKTYLEAEAQCHEIAVEVDNLAAAENVTRFLSNQGFSAGYAGDAPRFTISATRTDDAPVPQSTVSAEAAPTVVMLTHNTIGTGDLVLGGKLMVNFLKTLPELGESLWTVIMVNEAVKLACGETEAADELVELEKKGVRILVCGTCLEHFSLMPDKRVGETTNMLDIVTTLQVAAKVINM